MNKTPNCAICVWAKEFILGGQLSQAVGSFPSLTCEAHGGQPCQSVHGKRLCRKLFQEKTEALADMVMGKK